MTIRFDDAWAKALEVAKQATVSTHLDVVLVRDILGRVSVVLDDSAGDPPTGSLVEDLGVKLAAEAGPFIMSAPVTLDHPGNLGGSDSWEDAGPWRHRGSIQMSSASAR